MANGEPYTLKFMHDVVKLKLEQHPELKQLAMDCARDGILPIEVSQFDDNWASGKEGKGANMLGIAILELGNEYLRNEEPQTPIIISNPKAYYQQLQRQASTQLRHDSLVTYTQNMQGWQQNVTPIRHQTPTQTSSQQKAPYQSPAQYVRSKLAHTGCTDVNVVPALNDPSLKVVQLTFRTAQEALAFKQQHSGADTKLDGNSLTLGPVRAPLVFQKFGIEYYGIHNRRSTMQALIDASQPTPPHSLGNPPATQTSGKQTPFEYVRDKIGCAEVRVVPDKSNPSQKVVQLVFKNIQEASNFKTLHSGSTTPQDGRILTLGPTRAENIFEKFKIKEYGRKHPKPTMQALVDFSQTVSPQSTIVQSPKHVSPMPMPAKETPTEYVKRKLDSLHSGCNSVHVVPDAKRPSQQVIQLVFDNAQKADQFKAQYSGAKTPTSADGKTLTLGANRALQVFKNLEIEYYGRKHPRPTSQALIEEHQRKLGANNSPTPISSPSSRDASFYALGNKRLMVQDSLIVGYQYRDSDSGPWKDSGDPSRFKRLTESFRELQQIKTHYQHAAHTNNDNRRHLFEVSSDKFHNLKGDCLKTRLLLNLKSELTNYAQLCTSKEQFDKHVEEIKNSKEYEILATGQGLMTKIFGLETSSVTAFNKIAEEVRNGIDDLSLDEEGPQPGF